MGHPLPIGAGHCSQRPHSNGTAQGRDGHQQQKKWPGISPTSSISISTNMTTRYSTGAFPLWENSYKFRRITNESLNLLWVPKVYNMIDALWVRCLNHAESLVRWWSSLDKPCLNRATMWRSCKSPAMKCLAGGWWHVRRCTSAIKIFSCYSRYPPAIKMVLENHKWKPYGENHL